MKKYKIELNEEEFELYKKICEMKKYSKLKNTIESMEEKKVSVKKIEAMQKATDTRINKAKEKILNAINLLRIENKNISNYAIAKISGCSINTVKKYKTKITT